jgi:ketosteroid isomerase-like protein
VSGIAGWPEKDVYRGREEIEGFARGWASAFREWHFDVEEIRAEGDELYAVIREWGTGAENGASVDRHRYTVCSLRGGRIVKGRWFSDCSHVLPAADPKE